MAKGEGGDGEGKQSETGQMKSYTYKDEHAGIHVHDGVVGVGRCRPRVSASRSGGETTAASLSEDSLD